MRVARRHVAAVVAYLALALIWTWPLARDPGRVVPHDIGDPLASMEFAVLTRPGPA